MHRHSIWWLLAMAITVITVSCEDGVKYRTPKDVRRYLQSKKDRTNPNPKVDHSGVSTSYGDNKESASSYGDGYPSSYNAKSGYSNAHGKSYASTYPYHGDHSTYGHTHNYHYNPYVNGERFPNSYLEQRVDQLEKDLYQLRQSAHFGDPFSGLVFVDKNEILAFRVTAENGERSYERYIDTGNNDDESALTLATLPCGCRTPYGPCDRHFRSRILDAWPTEFFKKVRVTLYEDGKQVAFVDFDPANSTFLDFFRQERVKDSSYVDLTTADLNRFSIEGTQLGSAIVRRFYIHNVTQNCDTQMTIMFVNDVDSDFCLNTKGKELPIIYYSKLNTTAAQGNKDDIGHADVLTVTVILKEHGPEHRKCFP